MIYPVTIEQIKLSAEHRIAEATAELEALRAVTINTGHTKLTNRAVNGGEIQDYMHIDKALRVSYKINYPDGSTRYNAETITAYSYNDEQGNEIGSRDGLRISRTLTPTELAKQLETIINARAHSLSIYHTDLKRVAKIVAEQNKLAQQINTFNESLSHAVKGARI